MEAVKRRREDPEEPVSFSPETYCGLSPEAFLDTIKALDFQDLERLLSALVVSVECGPLLPFLWDEYLKKRPGPVCVWKLTISQITLHSSGLEKDLDRVLEEAGDEWGAWYDEVTIDEGDRVNQITRWNFSYALAKTEESAVGMLVDEILSTIPEEFRGADLRSKLSSIVNVWKPANFGDQILAAEQLPENEVNWVHVWNMEGSQESFPFKISQFARLLFQEKEEDVAVS